MADKQLSIEEFRRLLWESAGADDDVSLDVDALDTEFGDLGYDSVALLEIAGRIEREYGVAIDDDTASPAGTPHALLSVVNENLARQT